MIEKLLYLLAIILIIFSFYKDKNNTKKALKKAIKSFENILPTLLSVMIVVGITLAIIDKELIATLIGPQSGIIGVLIAIFIGSITMMAGFIAFPLGATLINEGAGISQIAGFISALMMVGIITIPLESRYWGKKATLIRNIGAFIFSIFVALIIGVVCR